MTNSTVTFRSAARSAAFTSTATTVVALLAIASAARIMPVTEFAALNEARPVLRDSTVGRAVAVAVAAARDLLGVDRSTTTAFDRPGHAPVGIARSITIAPLPTCRAIPLTPLSERLLDLPPPLV